MVSVLYWAVLGCAGLSHVKLYYAVFGGITAGLGCVGLCSAVFSWTGLGRAALGDISYLTSDGITENAFYVSGLTVYGL